MEDLSLHILDVVENGTAAGATFIEIEIRKESKADLLEIRIRDNGKGMDAEMLAHVCDPFITTRTTRRVGLGLSLLQQAAEETGGHLDIKSELGKGTEVRAVFSESHIDRKPLGDIGATIVTLIQGNPDIDFRYTSKFDERETEVDTREIRKEIGSEITLNNPTIINLIRQVLKNEKE